MEAMIIGLAPQLCGECRSILISAVIFVWWEVQTPIGPGIQSTLWIAGRHPR